MVDVSAQARVDWHGKWIWIPEVTAGRVAFMDRPSEYVGISRAEKNQYILARHELVIPEGECLVKATINITADSRYKLFVNGRYVGRGINRCESFYWYYNTYEINDFLQPGTNVIAIEARFYGQDFAYYNIPGGRGRGRLNAGKGGLLFDLALVYASGKTEWTGSGEQTRVVKNPGERSDLPLKNDALGFIQEFDARAVPRDWNELGFDDGAWNSPLVLDYPVKTLLPDANHPLHEEIRYPSEILVVGENDDVRLEMDEEDLQEVDFCIMSMLEGHIESLENFEVKNPNTILKAGGVCEIIPGPNAGGKVLSIYVRFPREVVGYPQVLVEGPAGAIIDILPTEKMRDNLPAMDFMGNKRGSRVILRGGRQFFEQWDWEGYLFMLVKIRDLTGPLKIYHLATNVTHMQLRAAGSFECSDPGFNKLWDACAHTLKCCAIDAYLDCPSREQRAYLGDAYPEALVALACFGEPRLTKKLIYDTAFGQRKDGITYSFHPGDYEIQTHIIPDYCLYWIQITADYILYTGDDAVMRDLYPHFLRAMDWFWTYVDPETGLLTNLPYWTFIDWSFSHDKPGKWAILNAQFFDVLQFLGHWAQTFGDSRNGDRFLTHAAQVRPAVDDLFWDETEGCYRDYFHEGALHGFSQMTNAYLVLKGIPQDLAKITKILARIFDFPGVEENDHAQIDEYYLKRQSHHVFGDALKDRVVVAQPFFMHQVNKFFVHVGRFDLLTKYLHKWLPMLELGPTGTIWETWSIDGSECHAWAATPAFDLSSYVLGIRPLEPGFTALHLAPHPLDLEWAKGSFPTCQGEITVSWKLSHEGTKNRMKITAQIPPGVTRVLFTSPVLPEKQLVNVRIGEEDHPVDEKLEFSTLDAEISLLYE